MEIDIPASKQLKELHIGYNQRAAVGAGESLAGFYQRDTAYCHVRSDAGTLCQTSPTGIGIYPFFACPSIDTLKY